MRMRSWRCSPEARSRLPIVLLVTTAACAAVILPAEQGIDADREAISNLAREVLAQGNYQTELPRTEAVHVRPSWLVLLAPLAKLLSILLPALLVGVLLLLVFWLLKDYLFRDARAGGPHRDLPTIEPDTVRGDRITDPRRLAVEGRYKDAMHALLLLAVNRLSRRSGVDPARSWTSRELVRRLLLPDRARDALRSLVHAVEVSHFGGADVEAADYDRCLDHYRTATGEELT